MKTTRISLLGTLIAMLALVSCQKDARNLPPAPVSSESSTEIAGKQVYTETTPPYTVTLLGPTQLSNGNWEWKWKIQNNNPGSGTNGTAQDLSHWGFPSPMGGCFNISHVVSAAYSPNGTNWTSFTPRIQVDPSSCVTVPVLKFDFGTSGSNASYFRLIVNKQFTPYTVQGYYKSGRRTGCGTFNFLGISCMPPGT